MPKKKKPSTASTRYIGTRNTVETRNFGGSWTGSLDIFLKKVESDVKALKKQGATIFDVEIDSSYVDDNPDSKPAITVSVCGYRRETLGEARARESRRQLYEELRKEFDPIKAAIDNLGKKMKETSDGVDCV